MCCCISRMRSESLPAQSRLWFYLNRIFPDLLDKTQPVLEKIVVDFVKRAWVNVRRMRSIEKSLDHHAALRSGPEWPLVLSIALHADENHMTRWVSPFVATYSKNREPNQNEIFKFVFLTLFEYFFNSNSGM